MQHSLRCLNPYFRSSSYTSVMKNIDVLPFIVSVFNIDEHNISSMCAFHVLVPV